MERSETKVRAKRHGEQGGEERRGEERSGEGREHTGECMEIWSHAIQL